MLAVKSMDVRENFKSLCDKVFRGETLIVSRPKNENIVMMSESEYNEIMKAKRNAEYLAMLDKSMAEAEAGGFITKTVDEFRSIRIMNVVFTPTAWQQYTDWQKEDKKIVKRINELIKSIDRDGLLEGIGKPEPLKYRKVCSRRITDEHRLTYNFDSNQKSHNIFL